MSPLRRLATLGPLTLLALSGACAQMLDIQDARVDATLTGGASAAQAGTGSPSDGGDQSSGGSSGAGAAGSHSGGAGHQAGTSATQDSAGAGYTTSAGAGDTGQPTTCETYCDAVLQNCKGKYEQYRSFDQCIEVCKRLPPGTPGDENVNSVECRIRQAHFAESEAFLYCKSAGPLGAGKCASNCVSYCSLMDATCTQSSTAGNVELSYFNDTQECLAACTALPDDPTGPVQYSSSATAVPSTLMGNNVFCRTYHVAAALEQDAPSEHCPHAMGGDPCVAQ